MNHKGAGRAPPTLRGRLGVQGGGGSVLERWLLGPGTGCANQSHNALLMVLRHHVVYPGRPAAQEAERVDWCSEGRWFDPRLLLAECGGVSEREALTPTRWVVDMGA